MNNPIRHKNHILETESNKFFENCLSNEWYAEKPGYDYGIDYNVSIVINNQVTGLNFSVQIKSTEKEESQQYVPISLKKSTLGLFQARLEPILLIAYVQEDKEAYWHWYNDLSFDLTSKQETYRVNIPRANRLSVIDWDEITQYVQNVFSIKNLIEGIKYLEYKELTDAEILAWRYYYSHDYEKAAFYFKGMLKEKPDDLTMAEALSYSLYMNHNYKDALFFANKLIDIQDSDSRYILKASILTEDGIQNDCKAKVLEGKNIFEKIVKSNPNHDQYHYNYANALTYLEKSEEAIDHYKKCLDINPNNAQAWKNLANLYNKLQQYQNAEDCNNKALLIEPNLSQALFSKGIFLSQLHGKHKEGLEFMQKAFNSEEEILHNYPHAYLNFAHAYEKLHNIEEALKWVDKGLSYYPEDFYFLQFKTRLLAINWNKDNWVKKEALKFFKSRAELGDDFKSLFFLIQINQYNETETFTFLKKHITSLNNIDYEDLINCNLKISSLSVFLLHYDKYLEFRKDYTITRYIDHLISPYYVIPEKFWDILSLIFAYCFSCHIQKYYENEIEQMIGALSKAFQLSPNALKYLLEEKDYTKEESTFIVAQIFVEFHNLILREFGAQLGYVAVRLDLENPGSKDILSEEWHEELQEKIYNIITKEIKL